MKTIDTIYIDGQFVTPHGREPLALLDPATEQETTTVILADEIDARRAIAAAKAAYPAFSRTTREQRMAWLQRLHDVVAAAEQDIVDVMVAEYGGTTAMAQGTARRAAASFAIAPPRPCRLCVRARGRRRPRGHGAAWRGRHDHAVEREHRLHREQTLDGDCRR